MKPSDAALLTAIVILVVLVAAWYSHRHSHDKGEDGESEAFCPGPHNVNTYDHPYKNYPSYEGRGASWWDGDHRCASYCAQSPCTVWCR